MEKSLRSSIAIPVIFIILISMLSLGGFYAYYFNYVFGSIIEKDLLADVQLISSILSEQSPTNSIYLESQIRTWSEILNARITVINSDGTVIGDSHANPVTLENHLNRPEIQQAAKEGYGISRRYSSTLKTDMLYIAAPILKNGQVTAYIRVAVPLTRLTTERQRLLTTIILVTLLTVFIATLFVINIAQKSTKPIVELTKSISTLSESGLSSDWKPNLTIQGGSKEVHQLGVAFNFLTEQLQKQIEALENERNKISTVLQEMTDGVLIIDQEGIIQLINPAVTKMLNLPNTNLIGKSIMQALDYPQFIELWQRARDSHEQQSAFIEIHPKKLYIQCTTTPLDQVSAGSVFLLLQNLTRQRYLETVRRDFISNISHELRTPLASLKALTETLQEGALDDPPAARKFLIQIETEVDSLSHMVSELLELSRIESGQVPLRLRPASPYEILDKVVERLGLQAERAGIQVISECSPNIPDVLADPQRLVQVLGNLFHNAIKFTPPGGKIQLSARAEGEKVLFCVKDTGIGIPPEDLPRIFERFYKTDRARASGGTGLGLAIAKHVVEAHGGIIWAESVEGQGSSFYFLIPQA